MPDATPDLTIRPLEADDLDEANRNFRLAFGTFMGLDDPLSDFPDVNYTHTRWLANPDAAFGAFVDDRLVASNFATQWGSVAFFGPLTVHPEWWDQGIGSRLMEPVMDLFEEWEAQHEGLFTFPYSGKHIGLYQKYGFWPRSLTAILHSQVSEETSTSDSRQPLSPLPADDREGLIRECRQLTDDVYSGLDVTREIRAVLDQELGEVLLLGGDRLEAFAVCHLGAETEAGSGQLYVKFGAVRPGPRMLKHFDDLLAACESLASRQGQEIVELGMSLDREDAYRIAEDRGYRIELAGVTMHRPNEPAYGGGEGTVIDDWR